MQDDTEPTDAPVPGRCPECGQPCPDRIVSCPRCGHRLREPLIVPPIARDMAHDAGGTTTGAGTTSAKTLDTPARRSWLERGRWVAVVALIIVTWAKWQNRDPRPDTTPRALPSPPYEYRMSPDARPAAQPPSRDGAYRADREPLMADDLQPRRPYPLTADEVRESHGLPPAQYGPEP